MIFGFTGTRRGLTDPQLSAFWSLLHGHMPSELHHGDCKGADKRAHLAFVDYVFDHEREGTVAIHPPTDPKSRAYCGHPEAPYPKGPYKQVLVQYTDDVTLHVVWYPEKPYLDRNKDIVDACDLLVACPAEAVEQQRGGTWSTVRYARRVGRDVALILPDGEVRRADGL